MPTYKPLPLKQRTSSVDHRRDYSHVTIVSLLGILKFREFLVTVDHFSIWRRHLAWAIEDGKELREYLTKRYASSMVFLSLLLGAELGVLFNSSGVTTEVREALRTEATGNIRFWVGIFIIFSAILTILGLISSFTAWTMVRNHLFRFEFGYCTVSPRVELPANHVLFLFLKGIGRS